jgi:hypothetical protein
MMLAAAACGSRQAPKDLCLTAVKSGPPPAELVCGDGAEPRSALAPPSRLARIPGPGQPAGPAERRWCQGADGSARGPYVALDRSGAVVESGRYNDAGELDGTWIVWAGVAPQAVGVYRDGVSVSLESCEFGR